MYFCRYKTPCGFDDIVMESDGDFLLGLRFENKGNKKPVGENIDCESLEIFKQTCKWLDTYFSGEEPNFALKYKFICGTDFQNRVWRILEQIPFGKTVCYGDIAKEISKQSKNGKMSAQAVGGAVKANPICIVVPCHRVVGKGGELVGYAGGIENKKQLLILEKVRRIDFESAKKKMKQ